MITPGPLITAAERRLQQRCYHEESGNVRMSKVDGSQAFWLTRRQYDDLVLEFGAAMQPINRILVWGFWIAIPVTLLTLKVLHSTKLDVMIDNLGMPWQSRLLGFLVLTWWPLLIVGAHWRGVRKVNATIDARLARLPKAPFPSPRPIALHTAEIAALFLVGPGLFLDIIATLFPHGFRHTPFMGRSVGLLTLAGIVVLGVIISRRWHFLMAQFARSSPKGDEPAAPVGRQSDFIARARAQDAADSITTS